MSHELAARLESAATDRCVGREFAADLRAAAQAVRAMEWRPIAEALKNEECLVGRKSWTDNAWFWGKCVWHADAHWRDWTHYLPLPAPPEVGG